MKEFYPKVSIIIPVYNGSKQLGDAIDSALAQTYKNIEIIVSNDGSNDGGATEKVAKSYGDKIIYLGKKENGGAATALNLAIKKMTGEYFSWLSHDDLYYPKKIQRQVEELAKLKNKNTIMMSELDGKNEKGEKIYQTDFKAHMESYPPREQSYLYPVVYNQTHGCTLLIPKKCFDTEGLFDPKERVAQDFELFYRIFKAYPHKLVPEVLVTARDTSNRMGRRAKPQASVEYSRLYIKILKRMSDEEIKLLAKDRLTLLSDLREFARYAGYTPLLEYVTSEILKYSKSFCKELILTYLNTSINNEKFIDSLIRLGHEYSQIHNDYAIATDAIDHTITEALEGPLSATINNNALRNPRRITNLYDLLLQANYKYASACLFKLLITSLVKNKQDDVAKDLIHKRLIGKDIHLPPTTCKQLLSVEKGTRKPRILFCSTHWLTGGMERVMSIILEQLKSNYEVFLLTPYDGRDAEILVPDGVKHIKISNSIFYSNFDNSALSLALILDIKILVGSYNLFDKQLELYRLCCKAGIKTVSSNHENFFYPYTHYGLQEAAMKRQEVYKNVDAALWPTNFSAAVCGLTCPNSYLMPNPNTFDVSDAKIAEREKIIICVGRFNDYVKRVDRILECFKLVQNKLPDSKLMLVGNCDRKANNELLGNKSINEMIIERDIDENNIIFTGEVSNMGDYYKRASVLVLASASEGFGMVINEAACFGVPSVCNEIPGVEDLVIHGENGFLTEQDDIGTMADYVTKILSSDDLREKLGNNAKKIVTKFDAKEVGDKWKYLLNTLVNSKSNETEREELKKRLAYKVKDQTKFSALILSALNGVVAKERAERAEAHHTKETHGPLHIAKYSVIRLVRSMKKNGVLKTSKILAKKVYLKLR